MVEGRIRRRANELKLESYASYLKLVRDDPRERPLFIDLVTTNETYFYRTPRIWEYLVGQFLPRWHETHKGQTFSAWSAAASSGEEAHTLAILLQSFKESHAGFVYQILGTDISEEMVSLCESGMYRGRSIEAFRKTKPDLFMKYMESGDGTSFSVKSEIKARMKFQSHNLFKPLASRGPFDLILVRNVLIYFTAADQEKVIANLEPRLKQDGVVIIGESESLSQIKTGLKSQSPLIYQLESQVSKQVKAA